MRPESAGVRTRVIALAAAGAVLPAGFLPAAVLRIEAAGRATEVRVVEKDGEEWVGVAAALRASLGGRVEIEAKLPSVNVAADGRRLMMAAGLRQIRLGIAPEERIAWLADPLRVIEGLPSLSPRSLPVVLSGLGVACAWKDPGKRLKVESSFAAPAAASVEEAGTAAAPPSRAEDGRFHVVVDAGHGGADCGAQGRGGTCEKEVTLDLALRIERLLRKDGIKVTMTRRDDRYVSLQKRVAITRAETPDLFLSIHLNAARNRSARGVETYVFGHHAGSAEQKRLVQAENADARYLDIILSDLEQRRHHDASVQAAGAVEEEMIKRMRLVGRAGKRIFEAPFYVLARSDCPAVLIEAGFLSNRTEEQQLRSPGYRQRLAEAITAGLLSVAR